MHLRRGWHSLKQTFAEFTSGHREVEIILPAPRAPVTMGATPDMAQISAVSEHRKSARVPLTLPVRVRWQGALGQTVEVTQTLDSSRTGLLFFRTQALAVNLRLWVTFPYAPDNPEAQPEIPARVARVKTTPGGGQLVAVEFEPQPRGVKPIAPFNRRDTQRMALALPMTVRFHEVPWPEQAMTQDVSTHGVLFRTARQYAVGDMLCVHIPHGIWARRGEMEARVVRVQPLSGSAEQHVALALGAKSC
jgi:hypothetical protein